MPKLFVVSAAFAAAVLSFCVAASAQVNQSESFQFYAPGVLVGEGEAGVTDRKVWFPGVQFPINFDPKNEMIYLNSQVYGFGGACHAGSCKASPTTSDGWAGDPRNFAMPWHDTFCEKGSRKKRKNPACAHNPELPHQGVDIRAPSNAVGRYDVRAMEAGTVTIWNDFTLKLVGEVTGTEFIYRHVIVSDELRDLAKSGSTATVREGDTIATVGNVQGYDDNGAVVYTSPHLHLEALARGSPTAARYPFPLYTTLVYSYTRKVGIGLPVTMEWNLYGSTPWEVHDQ